MKSSRGGKLPAITSLRATEAPGRAPHVCGRGPLRSVPRPFAGSPCWQSTSLIPADEHHLGSASTAWLDFWRWRRRGRWTSEAFLSINHPSAPFVGAIEKSPKVSLIGTLAMLIEAPGDFDLVQQGRIWALADALSSWPNVQEAVIGVTNVMLAFEQPPDDIGVLSASIVELWHRLPGRKADGKLIEIPVVYGGEQGFDLPAVAARAGLSEREVIRIHSDGEY